MFRWSVTGNDSAGKSVITGQCASKANQNNRTKYVHV